MVRASELPINTGASALQMAEEIFGAGVTVVSASYSGDNRSSGIYSDGDATSPHATPGDTGVILSTGRVTDFTNSRGQSNHSGSRSTNTSGENNNPDFNAAAGTNTYDAAYLDIGFVPTGSTMTLQFVFASDEYPEYTSSVFQDFVGIWVNGSQVSLSVGNGDTDPGNINSGANENLYLDNTNDAYNTEMDGLTVTMTLTMDVTPNVVNSIRIGIADVSDSSYDSNILIAGNSAQTVLVAHDDYRSLTGNQTKTIDVLGNDETSSGTLTITHINGQAVVAGDTITLPTGQTVTLNADATLTLVGDGTPEDFNFTYTVDNATLTDTGLVQISAIPCFVAGTRILTERGEIAVEHLVAGDRVVTLDNGLQTLRWVGHREVEAHGGFAPVHVASNTFGVHGAVTVSPQHRLLLRNWRAELLFGDFEVLVAAKDLVDGRSVMRVHGGTVRYYHLLFDSHQIVFSHGLASESFLPGSQILNLFDADEIAEISQILPGFDPVTGAGYGASARRSLKGFEVDVLLNRRLAGDAANANRGASHAA